MFTYIFYTSHNIDAQDICNAIIYAKYIYIYVCNGEIGLSILMMHQRLTLREARDAYLGLLFRTEQ